jgi:hypothetical protein
MADPTATTARLEIDARPRWLMWPVYLLKAKIRIDGTLHRRKWGTHTFDVAPGKHEIEISFWWLFANYARGHASVDVLAGQTARLRYRIRIFTFSITGAARIDALPDQPQLPEARVHR